MEHVAGLNYVWVVGIVSYNYEDFITPVDGFFNPLVYFVRSDLGTASLNHPSDPLSGSAKSHLLNHLFLWKPFQWLFLRADGYDAFSENKAMDFYSALICKVELFGCLRYFNS